MTKSIAPFRITIIDVEMINILIQGELLSSYIQLCHAQGYLSTAFNRLVTLILIYRVTYPATNK